MSEFIPTSSQTICVEKHIQAFLLSHQSSNYSQMGLGKSLVGLEVSEKMGLPILLVCDPIIKSGWFEKNKTFFKNKIEFITLSRGKVTPTTKIPLKSEGILSQTEESLFTPQRSQAVANPPQKEILSPLEESPKNNSSLGRELSPESEGNNAISYSILSGKSGSKNVCYDLLIRDDSVPLTKKGEVKKNARPNFYPTQKLKDLIEKGFLMIIDESHNVKNISSDRFWALRTIILEIKKNFDNGGQSRVLFLSATPFDKRDQIYNFLILTGISNNVKLLKKGVEYSTLESGRKNWEIQNRDYGLFSTYSYVLNFFDRNFTTDNRNDLNKRVENLTTNYKYWQPEEAKELCIEMYLSFIHPYLVCTMYRTITDEEQGVEYDKKNGFYCVSHTAELEIANALDTLKLALMMRQNKEKEYHTKFNGMVTTGMRLKEYAKRDLFARLAAEELQKDKNLKVIIGVDYKDTLHYLNNKLRAYSPLLIYGETSEADRQININKFNEDNNINRLLIVIVSTGKAGIDLHDTSGNHKRVMFLSPSYIFQNLTQMSGRIFRKGTLSSPKLRLVFSKQNEEEIKILSNLSAKVEVHKKVVGAKSGELLPGEYENEYSEECPIPDYFPSPVISKR